MLFQDKQLKKIQVILIIGFSCIPLFIKLPFKINLFLAWEGAYRISIGQIPFIDFSLPMGFGFWLIPAFFFKILGPSLYTLVIAQALINFIGAYSFGSILRKFGCNEGVIFLSLLTYCISFVFVNFWPWYNNTVFIFELIAINFLLTSIDQESNLKKITFIGFTSFFVILSIFTKQDGGGLALITVTAMLIYEALYIKRIKWMVYYSGFLLIFSLIFILPFIQSDILYWFNYGQPPHNTRININDVLFDIFEGSHWIKFYLLIVVVVILNKGSSQKEYFRIKKEMLFAIMTTFILLQAIVIQVTSYIPHNVNIYFHSAAIAFIAHHALRFNTNKLQILIPLTFMIMFWWSSDSWRYSQRIVERIWPGVLKNERSFNEVSKYTWNLNDANDNSEKINWKLSNYRSFKNVLLPEKTIVGIDSIMRLDIVKKQNLKVLNMSELTPLAFEMGYEPIKNHPLWFHKNVSLFEREINELCNNIKNQDYDLVLFEVIPNLNQFYPNDVRDCLQENYNLQLNFQAPRDNSEAYIEVYTIDIPH